MRRTLSILVLLAAVAFAVSPMLSNGFGGYRPDQFPIPQADPPIQPAGWAFSIWGLIFAWLVAGSAFGAWKRREDPDWQPMRPALLVSLALGAFWIETAHRTPISATVLIVAMLVPALAAFLRAGRQDAVWQVRPVALYAGWLTAASGVAVSVVLTGYGVLAPRIAALALIGVVLVVAVIVAARRPRLWTYRAGVIWALFGVIVANVSARDWLIAAVCGAGAVALLFAQRLAPARP